MTYWGALGLLPLLNLTSISRPHHFHVVLEQRQNVYVSGIHFFQNQNLSRAVIYPPHTGPLTHEKLFTFSRIDIGWSLHSAWEHTEEIWIGECKKVLLSIGLCLYSTGQWINQPQVQTLNKTVQEALVSRAITVSTHFCLVPDLLVACAGQGVSWWQCCCSRRRTTPSPGGSDQYPGNVCTQGSSKTASHCPGLQPNYTTCPVKKKWTVFTRL